MKREKQALRREIRLAFPGAGSRATQSAALCAHVLAWEAYRLAQVVGGYMPMLHEADVTPILQDALATGKTLVLPRCESPGCMSFHRVRSLGELVPGAYGLLEPDARVEAVPLEKVDLLLVPLEGITHHGMRLGKGGGYYDRALNDRHGLALGAALKHQWVENMPLDTWDMALDACADENGIYLFNLNPERNVKRNAAEEKEQENY